MGNAFIKILIAQYVVAGVLFLFDGNHAKALYWFGATIISLAVLWMK